MMVFGIPLKPFITALRWWSEKEAAQGHFPFLFVFFFFWLPKIPLPFLGFGQHLSFLLLRTLNK